jgi:hypothetical protein
LIVKVVKSLEIPSTLCEAPSDAEQQQNVLELIDTCLRQQIRADAFRRPATATNARL